MQHPSSDPSPSLRITEIFHSIQGETSFSGLPTVFIRLTGCPLRCNYCDTAYAFHGGERLTIEDIVRQVQQFNCQRITVTGGEPLGQEHCITLLSTLAKHGFDVSLETSGALAIDAVPLQTHIILDIKTPSCGESHRNLWSNLAIIKPCDQIKFVIGNRKDYDWSKSKILQYNLEGRVAELLFSPVHETMPASDLAQWIVDDQLNSIRLQLQIHKYLWGDEQGR